nr:MAG TPA: hypothetical protein [Caudoviricetes sp.]
MLRDLLKRLSKQYDCLLMVMIAYIRTSPR